MGDFHIHIRPDAAASGPFSGGMNAAEALRRAARAGCRAAGLVLRSDGSNLRDLAHLVSHIRTLSLYANVTAFAGVELAHVPPALLPDAVRAARESGAELVLVHGETLAEDVAEGTNLAAVEAGADILAHPGLLDEQTAVYAAEKGVALEFCACPRHAVTNAHVAAMALRCGCVLVPGSDARDPAEAPPSGLWNLLCRGAAPDRPAAETIRTCLRHGTEELVQRLMKRRSPTA